MPLKFLYILSICLSVVLNKQKPQDSFSILRNQMVEKQLKTRGIYDSDILDAFLKVDRHKFVPTQNQQWAYADSPLSIGEGQTISQPYIVAFMTQALNLREGDKVLEIGTGSGYQAAILAELGAETYSIEIIESLAIQAKQVLDKMGYKNFHLKTGDGYLGWAEHAPYDAIIVTCAPSEIPLALQQQLAENGRMIIPVGAQGTVQKLVLLKKKNGKIKKSSILPVRFVPMIDSLRNRY